MNVRKYKDKEYQFCSVRFYKPEDYHNFKALCDSKDLTITKAVNGLIKKALKENTLPYSEV